jgi:putative intracellular protease/amidase
MKIFSTILSILFACVALAPLSAADAKPQAPEINVAILIFEDVQIIDFTGPYEVLGQAGFNVFTVAASAAPVTTSMGMKVTPSYTLANAPAADILVVPGGDVRNTVDKPEVISWLRERARTAQHVLTVCNGAFILAKTGLLDGLTATTFYDLIPALREAAPKVHVVTDRRYVDNGQIITTAGLSSGIDGALHVVERILGHGRAQQVALNMEYDWRPDSGFARASLADAELRRIFGRRLQLKVPAGGTSRVVKTEGTTDRWEARWEVKTTTPLADLRAALTQHLTETGKWTPKSAAGAGAPREWTYKDADQKTWNAQVDLAPEAGKDGEYNMAIKVERAGV